MPKIKVLLIEDDEDMIRNYKQGLEEFNHGSDNQIILSICKNFEEGENCINTTSLESAIIDLKLSPSDDEGIGNKIIKIIAGHLPYPVFIITGRPDLIDQDIDISNPLINLHERTSISVIDIYRNITSIYNTGITKLLGEKGLIKEYLNKIFWNHLSRYFEKIKDTKDSEKVLARHISSYLQEYLCQDSSGIFDQFEDFEMYIYPPVKKYIFTGDLVKHNSSNEYYLVVNPPCNIIIRGFENIEGRQIPDRKASKILLLKATTINDIQEFANIALNDQLDDGRKGKLKKIIGNNHNLRYHFLPKFKEIPDLILDFESLKNISFEEAESDFTRIASISDQFLKDICSRFAIFYSRMGQPNFDTTKIFNNIINS